MASSWYIEEAGLAAFGNRIEPVEKQSIDAFKALETDEGDNTASWICRATARADAKRIISASEIEQFMHFFRDDSCWEPYRDHGLVQLGRCKDSRAHAVFAGSSCERMLIHLPRASLEQVVHSTMDFEERAKWDSQIVRTKVMLAPKGNNVVQMHVKGAPLTDRDFLNFHVVARNTSDRSLLLYQRFADDSLALPHKGAVRGRVHVFFTLLEEHPDGGVRISGCAVTDINFAFIPKWIINRFIPGELLRWAQALERQCDQLSAKGLKDSDFPCHHVLGPAPPQSPAAANPTLLGSRRRLHDNVKSSLKALEAVADSVETAMPTPGISESTAFAERSSVGSPLSSENSLEEDVLDKDKNHYKVEINTRGVACSCWPLEAQLARPTTKLQL